MIEKLPENTHLLAPLLIFVTGAFPQWQKIFRISKKEPCPPADWKTTRMSVRVRTLHMTIGETQTMTNDIRIKCRECSKHFKRLEWMQNKECENPNCRCPEVQKLRDAANDAINKASDSSRFNVINIKRATIDPTGYDEKVDQYMVDVPDVMVIDMIVPKQYNRKRK